MPNRYANLIGSEPINVEYLKINDGFDKVEQEVDALVTGAGTAQQDINTHKAATTAHSSTSAATAGRIMQRDAQGRAKVAAPAAADDIARKQEVDAVQTNLTNHAGSGGSAHAAATASAAGFMVATDKDKLDKSTSASTASTLMQRDGNGQANVSAPTANSHIARKQDVDSVQSNLTNHTSDANIHITSAEKTKLGGIAAGAEVNQNAFSQVNNVLAAGKTDTLTVEGGTGITVTTNPTTKKMTITATGTATPGAHASSHLPGGSDPLPLATASAAGLMAPADKTEIATIKDQLAEAATITHTLSQGQSIVEAQQASGASVVVLGQTRYNLLGTDGGCESLAPFALSGGSITLSTTIKRSGNSSIRCQPTSTQTSYFYKDCAYPLDPTKQYVFAAWVYIESYTSGSSSISIRDYGTNTQRYAGTLSLSIVGAWQFVYVKIPTSNTLVGNGFRLLCGGGSLGESVIYYDEIRLIEVSAAEYAAIGSTITGEAVDTLIPYIDGMQSVRGVAVSVKGRNLLPSFDQWTRHANAAITGPYELTLTATGSFQASYVTVPALPNRVYALRRGEASGNIYWRAESAGGTNLDGTVITGTTATINTPPNTARIRITWDNVSATSGTFKLSDIMLVLGDASSLPPSFVPAEDQTHIADVTLPSLPNGVRDIYDASKGEVWRAIQEVTLDGSLDWSVESNYTGYRRVTAPVPSVPAANSASNQRAVKKNGTLLAWYPAAPTAPDQFYAASSASRVYLSISNDESGWSVAPTAAQIKSFFAANPYRLQYQRATPVTEDVPHSGALTVHPGPNIVEVATGRVLREKVNPQKYQDRYVINNTEISAGAGKMKNRLALVLNIYKESKVLNKWTQVTHPNAYGIYEIRINEVDYDTTADYYVDYVVLDRHAYTTAIAEASVTVAANLGSAVGANTEDIARVKTHNDKQDTGIRELQLDAWALETMSANRNGYGVTAGTGAAYTVTLNPAPVGLSPGLRATVKLHAANLANATINANGFGAVPIRTSGGAAPSAGFLVQDGVYTFVHDGSAFILQGEGGGGAVDYGNAARSDVASGKSFAGPSGLLSGTGKLVNVTPNTGYPVNTINVPLPQVVVDFATPLYPSRLFTVGVSASVHYQVGSNPGGLVFYSTLVMIFKKVAASGTPGIEMIAGVISPTGAITAFNQDGSFNFNHSSDPMVTVQNKFAAFEYVAAWP